MVIDAIVFAHSGRADYLRTILAQAKASNPATRVVFLGDDTNRDLSGDAEFHPLSDFHTDLDRLEACYVHKSSNTYEFELSAIARWLAVANFCRSEGLSRIFNADTDVLIYSDLATVSDSLPETPISGYANGSGHASFWTSDALSSLRDLIFRTYEDRSSAEFAEISGVYDSCRGIDGGISDMYLIQMLCRTIPWFDLTTIVDGSTFDFNFSYSQNGASKFLMRFGEKAIDWKNDKPYGASDNGPILLHTLHLQGRAKGSIDRIVKQESHWLVEKLSRLAVHYCF